MGLLGGLLSAWNPKDVRCKYFITTVGIFLKVRFRDIRCVKNCLKMYAPYLEREIFWD